ncbi:MAG: contact-dependent growth inhibition system immunity protein [Chloroflexota bacterium]
MTDYETLYPELKYFFSAYFHSDWVDIYDWHGGNPSFQTVVFDFKNESKVTLDKTTQELKQFLKNSHSLSEAELREIVVHKLGANIYPPGRGLTYRQWLQAVLEILKET